MIKRLALPLLRRSLAHWPAAVIVGPRQCGKTTLVQTLAPDHGYATLDDEDASDAEGGLTSDDPLEELADHGHDDHEDALEPVNDDATLIAAE